MANPRYPQQQERQSPQDRKLSSIAGLVGLTNAIQGPQLEQRAAAEREHQNRVLAALQLLGLHQQQQDSAATQQYRSQELAQRGDIASQDRDVQQRHFADLAGQYWGGELPAKYTGLANESADRKAALDERSGEFWGGTMPAEYAKQATEQKDRQDALGAGVFAHTATLPGTSLNDAMEAGGVFSPGMATAGAAGHEKQNAALIAAMVPQMRAVGNIPALEGFRPKLGANFDAAKAQAFPPGTPSTGATNFQVPQFTAPPDIPIPPESQSKNRDFMSKTAGLQGNIQALQEHLRGFQPGQVGLPGRAVLPEGFWGGLQEMFGVGQRPSSIDSEQQQLKKYLDMYHQAQPQQ